MHAHILVSLSSPCNTNSTAHHTNSRKGSTTTMQLFCMWGSPQFSIIKQLLNKVTSLCTQNCMSFSHLNTSTTITVTRTMPVARRASETTTTITAMLVRGWSEGGCTNSIVGVMFSGISEVDDVSIRGTAVVVRFSDNATNTLKLMFGWDRTMNMSTSLLELSADNETK